MIWPCKSNRTHTQTHLHKCTQGFLQTQRPFHGRKGNSPGSAQVRPFGQDSGCSCALLSRPQIGGLLAVGRVGDPGAGGQQQGMAALRHVYKLESCFPLSLPVFLERSSLSDQLVLLKCQLAWLAVIKLFGPDCNDGGYHCASL